MWEPNRLSRNLPNLAVCMLHSSLRQNYLWEAWHAKSSRAPGKAVQYLYRFLKKRRLHYRILQEYYFLYFATGPSSMLRITLPTGPA